MRVIVKNIVQPFSADAGEAVATAKKRLAKIGARFESGEIYRRSVDARKKNDIKFVYSVLCESRVKNTDRLAEIDACEEVCTDIEIHTGERILTERPVVCGFGPAGMFAALLLAENGYRPLVIERGSDVFTRREEVERFNRTGVLNSECNIQFGAGGAGTFSDGKLVTRINDPRQRYILERLCEFGAPDDILVRAKPHIGTDKLLNVVDNIAKRIISLGGEIRYDTRLDEIRRNGTDAVSVTASGAEIPCGCLVLATGHSARDTYSYLLKSGYSLIPKPFSVGVRIEHLRSDIDKALYGDNAGNPILGAAEYTLSKRVGEKGVYSFCMCPGGSVVGAASEQGGVVTNGMSTYARDGVNSNSALAVSCESPNPMEFQRKLERAAFELGGGDFSAPVMTVGDFLSGSLHSEFTKVQPTYMNSRVRICDLSTILPENVTDMLRLGIRAFGRTIDGFDSPDAVLTGVETRTSAPFRILRTELLTSCECDNIYPCGEGAGYAGGITSAALDGVKVALEIMKKYRSFS